MERRFKIRCLKTIVIIPVHLRVPPRGPKDDESVLGQLREVRWAASSISPQAHSA
jgi:hypothetical protein